jgi:hypothetical protein
MPALDMGLFDRVYTHSRCSVDGYGLQYPRLDEKAPRFTSAYEIEFRDSAAVKPAVPCQGRKLPLSGNAAPAKVGLVEDEEPGDIFSN